MDGSDNGQESFELYHMEKEEEEGYWGALMESDGEMGSNGASTEERRGGPSARLVPADLVDLPKQLKGVPVFRVTSEESGVEEEVIFLPHLFARVLSCVCRSKQNSGMFRCKVYREYRRHVKNREWRMDVHNSVEYAPYKARYPLARFKEPSAAITVAGAKEWVASLGMDVFVAREADKCKTKGCAKSRCTCSH